MNWRRKEPVPVVQLEQLITRVTREAEMGNTHRGWAWRGSTEPVPQTAGTEAGRGSDSIPSQSWWLQTTAMAQTPGLNLQRWV